MTGVQTVQRASFNFSGPRLAPVADHVTTSVEHVERPLMTPDEITRLRPPKKEGRGANERISAPGDMLIFVSGSYPIYGRQILYFKDRVLSKRALMPSPQKFEAIEYGHVVAQKPFDRTVNVISHPEIVVPEGMSPMERAFHAALNRKYSSEANPGGFLEDLSLDNERRH
jgi:type IV secretion system protein VirD4